MAAVVTIYHPKPKEIWPQMKSQQQQVEAISTAHSGPGESLNNHTPERKKLANGMEYLLRI